MPTEFDLNWPPRDDGESGPSPRQAEFFRCGAKEQLYGGSKRGGKTVAGCAKAIYLSYLYPGNRGFILRQAFTDLRESTLETFFQLLPKQLLISHNKTDHHITLRTRDPQHPSKIIYAGLGEESELTSRAKEKAKSKDSGWFWIDEPSEVSFEAYRMMLAQLCWHLPNGTRPPYMALLTSNPEPGWVKDRFIDKEHPSYIIGKADARFIPSLPKDNPGLPPNWERDLRLTETPEWVQRYLDGSWDIHEGMAFPELNALQHDLDKFTDAWSAETYRQWIASLKLYAGMDHGTTGITAAVQVGVDRDDNLYCLREHYQENRRIDEHAPLIGGMLNSFGKQEMVLIDPSTEAKTQMGADNLYSYLDEWIRHLRPFNIYPHAAHRSAIEIGVDVMRQRLHPTPHKHPFTDAKEAPRMFIARKQCPNLWREMANMKRIPREDGTLVFVGADHAVDCVRYVVMSRPVLPPKAVVKVYDHLKYKDPGSYKQWRQVEKMHERWRGEHTKGNTLGEF